MKRFWLKRDDGRIEGLEKAVLELGAIVRAQGDAIKELEKPVRDLEMEWADWFEKFRNLYARITKRQQREVEEEKPPEGVTQNPLALNLLRGIK